MSKTNIKCDNCNAFYSLYDKDFVDQEQYELFFHTWNVQINTLLATTPPKAFNCHTEWTFDHKNLENQNKFLFRKCQSWSMRWERWKLLESEMEERERLHWISQQQCTWTHMKDQTCFNEDNGNCPYVNDAVRFIFRWQKFKPAGFIEYCDILWTICHTVTTKGLGCPDHVSQEKNWKCCPSAMVNKRLSALTGNAMQKLKERFIGMFGEMIFINLLTIYW